MWYGMSLAQIKLIQEDFNTFPTTSPALPHQGWVNNVLSGDSSFDQWNFGNPGSRNFSAPISGRFAIFDSDEYSGAGGAENIALESPAFSAQNYSTIRLKFDQYFDGIYNSTDSILVEVYNGNKWLAVYSYTGSSSITNSQDLNITANLAGTSDAKIRFRFVGDWSYYWIIDNVSVEAYYNYDAGVEHVSFSSGSCGTANDSISVTVRNFGLQSFSNFVVRARVAGTMNGNPINSIVSATYSGSLLAGNSVSLKLPPFNTASGGAVVLSAWPQLTSDQNRSNDTMKNTSLTFLGTPNAPSASGATRCGLGTLNLQASGVSTSDSVVWYDAPNALTPIGSGLTYTTAPLTPGNYTYYVAAGRGVLDNRLQTFFTANNGQSGVMFNVSANRTIVVDSFEVSIDAGTHLVEVYYKVGSYAGYETDAAAWTLLGKTTVSSAQANGGSGLFVNVGKSVVIPSGSMYSFYIQLPNALAINYTNGAGSFNNSEISIQTGVGVGANFGATFSPRSFNGGVYYSYFPLCESPRAAVQFDVKTLPSGSDIIQGKPFIGTFNKGDRSDPHVVANGDSLSFEILPPNGKTNAGYGSDWIISSLRVETERGMTIPSTDTTFFKPGSHGNGILVFVPSLSLADSIVHIKATLSSLISGCDTTMEVYVYVAPRPQADYAYVSVCNGNSMTFVNQSSIQSGTLKFEWNFDGLSSTNVESPDFTFPLAGTYSVILKAISDYGYIDYDTQLVVVKGVPQTSFMAVNACEGSSIELINNTNMPTGTASFSWNFGDGNTANTPDATHRYAAPGTYIVTFRVDVNGCSATAKKAVTQAPRAVVDFSSVSSCNNSEVAFSNESTLLFGSMGYRWDFGDSIIATTKNPKHNYAKFGTFNVLLMVYTDLGCVDSFSKAVTLIQAPEISISYSAPCAGEAIDFTNQSIVPAGFTNSYQWNFGDGTQSTAYEPSHTYPGTGTYNLFIRSSSTNGCSDSLWTNIIVNEKPMAGIVVPPVVCDGDEVKFLNSTVSSKISQVTYTWDFGNNTYSAQKDTSFIYSATGSYDVEMIATITGGCADTVVQTVEVSPLPLATFSYASVFTKSGTMQFWADEQGTNTTYTWFFDDGFKSFLKDPIHTFTYDRTYSVELYTENSYGCKSSNTELVRIYRTALEEDDYTAEIQLFPNPNSEEFILTIEGNTFDSVDLNVLNVLGQEVRFIAHQITENAMSVKLNQPSKGVYYLHLLNESGEQNSLRFVVR